MFFLQPVELPPAVSLPEESPPGALLLVERLVAQQEECLQVRFQTRVPLSLPQEELRVPPGPEPLPADWPAIAAPEFVPPAERPCLDYSPGPQSPAHSRVPPPNQWGHSDH